MIGFPFYDFEFEEGDSLDESYIPVKNLPLDCTESIAPFVPASDNATEKAIKVAELLNNDILCDLGMGNGKILAAVLESKLPIAKLVGVELDEQLFEYVKWRYPSIHAIQGDMFKVDLGPLEVSVFILYLLPAGILQLKKKLMDWFYESSRKRIVTIGYQIEGWIPVRVEPVLTRDDVNTKNNDVFKGGESGLQYVYLYDKRSVRNPE
jgi:hypothetical protein